jgi:hypothetical protein
MRRDNSSSANPQTHASVHILAPSIPPPAHPSHPLFSIHGYQPGAYDSSSPPVHPVYEPVQRIRPFITCTRYIKLHDHDEPSVILLTSRIFRSIFRTPPTYYPPSTYSSPSATLPSRPSLPSSPCPTLSPPTPDSPSHSTYSAP